MVCCSLETERDCPTLPVLETDFQVVLLPLRKK